jgi:hypothetical protein
MNNINIHDLENNVNIEDKLKSIATVDRIYTVDEASRVLNLNLIYVNKRISSLGINCLNDCDNQIIDRQGLDLVLLMSMPQDLNKTSRNELLKKVIIEGIQYDC